MNPTPVTTQPDGEKQVRMSLDEANLDDMTGQVAVLDKDGFVVATNAAWRRTFEDHDTEVWCSDGCGNTGIGSNFLDVGQQIVHVDKACAKQVADGIKQVLSGQLLVFNCEYACQLADGHRRFSLAVTPVENQDGGAVLRQTDITDRHSEPGSDR